MAALRALETGTLSSGRPRRYYKSGSGILSTQPVTKSEKRRKSKDAEAKIRSKDITRSSSSQPARRSSDLLGSGSQPGSARSSRRVSKAQNPTSNMEGVLLTRSGRTPAERLSHSLGNSAENAAISARSSPIELQKSAAKTRESPQRESNSTAPAEPVLYESAIAPSSRETAVEAKSSTPLPAVVQPVSNLREANLAQRARQEKVSLIGNLAMFTDV